MFFKNQRIGKYQIMDTIGTGGFGSVYLAKDVMIDKKVAIKVPHKQGENVEKLLQEPRLLAALNHPNIVSVITADKTNGVFYIVMEYVEGQSLEKYLKQHRRLQVPQALDWFIRIAEALSYAHKKGIIHRDVRPANVLLSDDGLLKVADLGTSRYLLDNPHASTRIGSPPYMAPEHFQGKATYQSDVYSLGILMYECLAGRLPFYDKNPRRLAQIVTEGGAEPLHQINPEVPEDLSRIIHRAMHRKLNLRHASADELINDLGKVQLHERIGNSQELAHLLDEKPNQNKEPRTNSEQRSGGRRVFFPKEIPTREISSLFCWNCSKPIQRRTRNCPHCNEPLK